MYAIKSEDKLFRDYIIAPL